MTSRFTNDKLQQKVNHYQAYLNYLGNVYNTENFKKGIDKIIAFRNQLSLYYPAFKGELNQQLEKIKRPESSL